jgi:Secretion system C-terminal sorting domain
VSCQSTIKYYNNYDISFHNEVWSTAMMGCYATSHTWNWPIVHRWPMTNPEPFFGGDNEVGDVFQFTPAGGGQVTDEIKTSFHNYTPLADFFNNNVNLESELTPRIFYSDSLGVEIYYMVNQAGTAAYGWIHNLNAYWANKYYYSDLFENYYGCTNPLSPPYTLTGFNANDSLGVYFYPTRMGSQTLPTNYTAHIGNDGSFDFDLPDVPLGCDSVNADFAFVVLPFGHNRMSGHRDEVKKQETKSIDFSIHPNPTDGKFTLVFQNANPDVKAEIAVLDVIGRIVLFKEVTKDGLYSLDLSWAAKGIYFIRLVSSETGSFKKIIIQ